MPIGPIADKLGRGQRLTASDRAELVEFLNRAQQIAARVQATDHGGSSRDATFSQLTVDKDLIVDTGTARIGPVASGKGNILLSSGGIQLRTNTTKKIDLQTDGDVFIGENTAAAATTNIAIFTAAQTYNSESVAAGDMLIGDNSSSKANIYWDKSTGQLIFRSGTTTRTIIDTDGSLNFANNVGVLKWTDSGGATGKGVMTYDSSNSFNIQNNTAGGKFRATITTTDTNNPYFEWDEDPSLTNGTFFSVRAGAAGARFTVQDASGNNDFVVNTSSGNADVTASGDITAANLTATSAVSAATAAITGNATVGALLLAAGAGLKAYTGTLADDAILTLTGEHGLFLLREHTGNTIALIRAAYGATGVAISSNITNLVFTDTDTNWCFYYDSGAYQLKNRNGASRDYTIIALSLS